MNGLVSKKPYNSMISFLSKMGFLGNLGISMLNTRNMLPFQLEKVTITFDGGLTTMNFAEAAMVIQGSACVYSKKVLNLIFNDKLDI